MRTLTTAVLIGMIIPRVATAGLFQDDFYTRPFDPPARWCERWHDVHWDSVNKFMVAIGVANNCSVGLSCCTVNCLGAGDDPPFCSDAPGAAAVLITTSSLEPSTTGNTRQTRRQFGLLNDLNQVTGDHVALLSVTHPNCHANFQAVVGRDAVGYFFQILKSEDLVRRKKAKDGEHGGV